MHNLKEIRKDVNFFKKKIQERNAAVDFENLLNLDKENREIIQKKKNLNKKKKYYLNIRIQKIFQNLKN